MANAIKDGLEEASIQVTIKKAKDAEALDYFDYGLVCENCPSYSYQPPEPMTTILKKKFAEKGQNGKINAEAAHKILCVYSSDV